MIELILVVVLLGLLAYAAQAWLPIPQPFLGILIFLLAAIAIVVVARALAPDLLRL